MSLQSLCRSMLELRAIFGAQYVIVSFWGVLYVYLHLYLTLAITDAVARKTT